MSIRRLQYASLNQYHGQVVSLSYTHIALMLNLKAEYLYSILILLS